MYYFLRTSPRVTFRKRAVLFGVKGKGMGISGYSIPPLEKHRATGKNVYTHILFCLCVCFVWERIEKLEQKREKKEERETSQRAKGAVIYGAFYGAVIPCLFGTRDQFYGRQFFDELIGNGFWMIQVHYIHCSFYFYYYYLSSTSDCQASDPGGWRCLP